MMMTIEIIITRCRKTMVVVSYDAANMLATITCNSTAVAATVAKMISVIMTMNIKHKKKLMRRMRTTITVRFG